MATLDEMRAEVQATSARLAALEEVGAQREATAKQALAASQVGHGPSPPDAHGIPSHANPPSLARARACPCTPLRVPLPTPLYPPLRIRSHTWSQAEQKEELLQESEARLKVTEGSVTALAHMVASRLDQLDFLAQGGKATADAALRASKEEGEDARHALRSGLAVARSTTEPDQRLARPR